MSFQMIDRMAVTISPKKPYLDWAHSLDEAGPELCIDDPHFECTVYLVDDVLDSEEVEAALLRHHRQMFEHELYSWHTESEAWPAKRDYATFLEWFEVKISSVVVDLSALRIDHERM